VAREPADGSTVMPFVVRMAREALLPMLSQPSRLASAFREPASLLDSAWLS